MAAMMDETRKAQAALDALAQISDDGALAQVVIEILKHKPQVCPAVVAATCPDLTYAPSKAITDRRARGIVKQVNANGGYGFISCPDIASVFGCDVFAHSKQLGSLQAGTEVSFAILLNKDSKPQAFDIEELPVGGMKGLGGKGAMAAMAAGLMASGGMEAMMSMMSGAMGAGAGAGKSSTRGVVKGMAGKSGELGQFIGTIKNFNNERGFGFLTIPLLEGRLQDGGDVFLHQSQAAGFGTGHQVKCTVYLHNGRAQAKELSDATGMDPFSIGADALEDPTRLEGGGGGGYGGAEADPSDAMSSMMGKGGKGGMMGGDQELGTFVGTVKNFNQQKGYGFIHCPQLVEQGYGDVFVHQKNIHDYQAGDVVQFTAFLHRGQALQAKDLSGSGPALKMARMA
eukprot:gb/GFBE01063183.1/.p1 GENE.gb/GFBE01063183.1/~~gb/GFBE01063183.1/.p1  ORF type:complete len:399 (+),score=103.45 gb/GFBE01063183.1/:1-1197(+)